MEKKEMSRDELLDEILRETAAPKTTNSPDSATAASHRVKSAASASDGQNDGRAETVHTASRRMDTAGMHTASVPQTEPIQPESELESETGSDPAPAAWRQTASMPAEQYDEMSGHTSTFDRMGETASHLASQTASRRFSIDPLYADLEGESQPFRPELARAAGTEPLSTRPRKKRKKHRVVTALIMIIVIIAVSVLLSSLMIVYGRDLLGIDSDSSTKIVTIPQGATVKDVAQVLEEAGIIDKPEFFVLIAGMSDKDGDIKPGDHELRADMAYETILSELVSDPLDSALSVSVTFPEGIRLVDAADLLEENNVCDASEFLDYFDNDAQFGLAYEEYLPSFQDEKFYHMEGYLFPDTYTFYQEMDVELVCEKILSNFNSKITTEMYDRMEALDLSLDDTITLASMIQAEAGNTEQMATISSVFWNRLNNATEYPLLQSDPTTKYVEEVIKPHSESYDQDLYDSYDTYVCTGLPAGPIGNPGLDAITAALYPENTNYYYFYSNIDTKETFFAETLQEHEANQEKVKQQQAAAEEAADEEADGDAAE